jgi:hypothetical protein
LVHRFQIFKLLFSYIVFASEIRKNIQKANPEATFGEISRIVGEEWRALAASKKEEFEEKGGGQACMASGAAMGWPPAGRSGQARRGGS